MSTTNTNPEELIARARKNSSDSKPDQQRPNSLVKMELVKNKNERTCCVDTLYTILHIEMKTRRGKKQIARRICGKPIGLTGGSIEQCAHNARRRDIAQSKIRIVGNIQDTGGSKAEVTPRGALKRAVEPAPFTYPTCPASPANVLTLKAAAKQNKKQKAGKKRAMKDCVWICDALRSFRNFVF